MSKSQAVWAAALAGVLLAACAQLPTAGPVAAGDGTVGEPGPVYPQGYRPPVDAGPEEIVRGFLGAEAAGVNDAFALARDYLTRPANAAWEPVAQVIVYSGSPTASLDEAGDKVTVSAVVRGSVDAEGRFAEAAPDEVKDVEFGLTQDADGQWRIDKLENGVLLSKANFEALYRATPLYFVSPDRTFLVPEVRWFPLRNTATYAARALLSAGPSTWLRDAVLSAAPAGTELAGDSVTVDATGTAVVELTPAVYAADAADKALLVAQLEAVLRPLPSVRSVRISVQGVPLDVAPDSALEVDPDPTSRLLVLDSDGAIASISGTRIDPLHAYAPVASVHPLALAAGTDGKPIVVLAGSSTLMVAEDGSKGPRAIYQGARLLAPSVDRFSWVWTGEQVNKGVLVAAGFEGDPVVVEAPWLRGRAVRSIRVSRDGARIAIVSSKDGATTIDVAGIMRDDVGTPQRIADPWRVGSVLTSASQVVWVDESTLAVQGVSALGTSEAMHLVPLAGFTVALPALPGSAPVASIAAGKGDRSLFAVTVDGDLYVHATASWSLVARGVSLPAFAG